MMPNIADDLKNALSSVVSGVGDVVSTVQNVTRKNVVELLQGVGNVAAAGFQTIDQVVGEGLETIASTGVSLTEGASGLVRGVIDGAKDAGVNATEAAGEAASQAVKTASKVGGDVGGVAVSSVQGAIAAAGDIGADSGELAKSAVMGTLRAADEIGSEAGGIVRKALLSVAALPHDIIDALLNGKTE